MGERREPMRNFDYHKLAERTWDNEILSYVAQIHEHKGRQELFLRQKPLELIRLIEIAKIQSTERLQGSRAGRPELAHRRK